MKRNNKRRSETKDWEKKKISEIRSKIFTLFETERKNKLKRKMANVKKIIQCIKYNDNRYVPYNSMGGQCVKDCVPFEAMIFSQTKSDLQQPQ